MRLFANNTKDIRRNFFTRQKCIVDKRSTRKFVKIVAWIYRCIDKIQYISRCTNTFRR